MKNGSRDACASCAMGRAPAARPRASAEESDPLAPPRSPRRTAPLHAAAVGGSMAGAGVRPHSPDVRVLNRDEVARQEQHQLRVAVQQSRGRCTAYIFSPPAGAYIFCPKPAPAGDLTCSSCRTMGALRLLPEGATFAHVADGPGATAPHTAPVSVALHGPPVCTPGQLSELPGLQRLTALHSVTYADGILHDSVSLKGSSPYNMPAFIGHATSQSLESFHEVLLNDLRSASPQTEAHTQLVGLLEGHRARVKALCYEQTYSSGASLPEITTAAQRQFLIAADYDLHVMRHLLLFKCMVDGWDDQFVTSARQRHPPSAKQPAAKRATRGGRGRGRGGATAGRAGGKAAPTADGKTTAGRGTAAEKAGPRQPAP